MGGDVPEELVSDELRKQIDNSHYNLAQTDGTITELREIHEVIVKKKRSEWGDIWYANTHSLLPKVSMTTIC
jgi:hypothetical protein